MGCNGRIAASTDPVFQQSLRIHVTAVVANPDWLPKQIQLDRIATFGSLGRSSVVVSDDLCEMQRLGCVGVLVKETSLGYVL